MKYLFAFASLGLIVTLPSVVVASDNVLSLKEVIQPKSKYIEFSQHGNPADVLEVKEAPARILKRGDVKVKVLAAPINPADLLRIAGYYPMEPVFPSTAGSEGVGRVIETAENVQTLSAGQLVLILGDGTWRDEIIAPESKFLPLTGLESLDSEIIEQLSMSVVNPITALLMITSFVELKEGDWLVQSAANSAVGGYVIQLARQRGIKTVNIVRRDGLTDDLIAKGADVVLVDGSDLAAKIASATNDASIALALDPVGGDTFTRLVDSLGQSGTLVVYGALSGRYATLNTPMTIFKDIRIRGFWLSKWLETASMEDKKNTFGQIVPLIVKGTLRANVDSRFTIAEIKKAVSRAAEDGRNGKVLIVPGGSSKEIIED